MLIVAGICGFTGPLIISGLTVILGSLYPGYSHISQTISVLGAVDAPHKIIMNTLGFIFLGSLIVIFAMGIEQGIDRKGILWIGPALIIISGITLAMTGVFPGDPQNIDVTWRGTTHSVFAFITAISFATAPIFIGARQWWDIRWKRYVVYSEVTGIVTLLLSLISSLDVMEPQAGLFQRISMGVPMIWMMVMSVRLLSINRMSER